MSPARRKPAAAADAAASTEANEPSLEPEAGPAPEVASEPEAGPAPEAATATAATEATETCPWCSAKVPAGIANCPSCGASLRDAVDGDILGVTQIDPAAVSRASRVKPGRLATWLGAEAADDTSSLGGNVEPPSREVREEMLRLELAAIDAEIEAKKNAAEAQRLVPDDVDLDAPEAKPS